MIIMINGAFGVGKTTIASGLVNEIENSMIFDPEEIGFMLRNILPQQTIHLEANTGDFQDLELWKELTVQVAHALLVKYKKNLIVPMTIRKPEYYLYIKNGFSKLDTHTYHFCLTASKETIYRRLGHRGEEAGNWCFQQTDKCLTAFNEYNFGEYIDTDRVAIPSVIAEIKNRIQDFPKMR